MTMRESLLQAMHLPADSDAATWMAESGVAVADEDTMSRAIHDVYCGITSDPTIRARRTISRPRC